MTRALTLVRAHVISSLRDIASDVSKRIADGQLNNTTLSALLYAKFRVNAPELKKIGLEIQKRTLQILDAKDDASTEYKNLMTELRQSFAATRSKLILPLMKSKLNSMALAPSTAKDLVAFARSSISYVRSMCLDECDLWREWFEGEDGLHDFLKSVCEPLYDQLRPRIVKETQLLKLCELCTLIQTRYTHDLDEDPEPTDPDQLEFSVLIQPVLEETQRRLLFRARAMVRDEIENYRSKPEELDSYITRNKPLAGGQDGDKLHGAWGRPPPSQPDTPIVADNDEDFGDKVAEYNHNTRSGESWYPTLDKAIWLLSRIYRLLNVSL